MSKTKYWINLCVLLSFLIPFSNLCAQANLSDPEATASRISAVENNLIDKPKDSNAAILNILERMKLQRL